MDGGGSTQQRCFCDSKNSPSTNVHGCTFVDEVSAPHICKRPLFNNYFFWFLLSLWRTGGGWITAYSLRNVFSTATDGGVSIQKHVLLFAKRAIKPVQGRTGLILPLFSLVSFCRCCFLPAVFLRFRSKNRRCFLIVHGRKYSKMYFRVHF